MEIIKQGSRPFERYGFVCEECGTEFLVTDYECEFLTVYKNNGVADTVRFCQCPTCKKLVGFVK